MDDEENYVKKLNYPGRRHDQEQKDERTRTKRADVECKEGMLLATSVGISHLASPVRCQGTLPYITTVHVASPGGLMRGSLLSIHLTPCFA